MKKLNYTIKTTKDANVKVKRAISNALGFEASIFSSVDGTIVVEINESALETFRTLINNLKVIGSVIETDPKL
mgnify:CR=1 FL=1